MHPIESTIRNPVRIEAFDDISLVYLITRRNTECLVLLPNFKVSLVYAGIPTMIFIEITDNVGDAPIISPTIEC